VDQSFEKKPPVSFTDMLRLRFKNILDPIGASLNKAGILPNTMTLIGLLGNICAAFLLARGQIVWGGMLVLLMAPVDALDGTMARLRGTPSRFGGFLDSVFDRYSDLLILGGLLVYYAQQSEWVGVVLAYFAAIGTVLVSYVKARAEAAEFKVSGGLLSRVERYIVLVPCLLLNRPMIALWILAVLANFTALQRIWIVRNQAKAQNDILE
jgi:CDP-diacylglycerol---glycerol-3-phosphate 3-phosphatidyltransferase